MGTYERENTIPTPYLAVVYYSTAENEHDCKVILVSSVFENVTGQSHLSTWNLRKLHGFRSP